MTAKLRPSRLTSTRFLDAIALYLPSFLIAAGVLLTLWMQIYSRNGVVFSGDGGLKALLAQQMARQLSAGEWPIDIALNLPVADWVNVVWQQGLYPFKPPFVYEVGSQHFITFPFTFPAVSAPFYALFGDRGLYIIPLVALWSIWLRFWQIGRRAGWDLSALCLGLMSLIFASPLSLYGGMYWEHTLAVALAFWGVSALVFPRLSPKTAFQQSLKSPLKAPLRKTAISDNRLLGSGILIALAVWFRPEFLCLVAAASLLAVIGWLMPSWRLFPPLTFNKVAIFIGSMACTLGLFFALNYGIYGHPLGIHAIQIVEESSLSTQVAQAKDGYQQMFSSLMRYFPVVVLVGIAALLSPELKKATLRARQLKAAQAGEPAMQPDLRESMASAQETINPVPARFALALSILFAIAVPLIVPDGAGGKQWGPRFYLILVPLLSLVMAEQLRIDFLRTRVRQAALIGAVVVLVLGIQLNTVKGVFTPFKDDQSISLPGNYAPIAPAITELRQQPLPWVAMSHEFVAQQLWSALPQKTFFRTESIAEVKKLAEALTQQNESEFLYVCYPHRDCPAPQTPASELTLPNNRVLTFVSLDGYSKYPLYRVEISSSS
jgi:hypothetical protein